MARSPEAKSTKRKPMTVLQIVLCIFLPPVAVYMKCGANKSFVINLLLWFLTCGIGGIIHAFIVHKN
jgi:uncharacterized membrane protein YqaE (UPF0057 family)